MKTVIKIANEIITVLGGDCPVPNACLISENTIIILKKEVVSLRGEIKNIEAEFNDMPHKKGTLSMARAQDPNSADSQFFICFDETPHLDGQYTVWGEVIEGMEFVESIKRGDPVKNGLVDDPDKIIKMWIE